LYKYIMYITLVIHAVETLAETSVDRKSISAGEGIVLLLKNKNRATSAQINTLKSAVKNTAFSTLHGTLQDLSTLMAQKTTDMAQCSLISRTESNDFLEKAFKALYTKQCVSNLFTYTLQDTNAEITDTTLKYLTDYIAQGNAEQIINLVKQQKNNTKNLQKISTWVNQLLSSDLLIPNDELLEHMEIDPAITNSIYRKMDNQLNFTSFKSEINSMSLGLMNSANQEDISNNTKYFISYLHQNRDFLQDRFISETLNKTGRFLIMNDFNQEAKELFTYNSLIKGPELDFDSVFYYLLLAITQGDENNVSTLISKYKLVENYRNLPPRLKYWVANQSEKNIEKALQMYQSLISDHPFDFYSIAAITRYQTLKGSESGRHIAQATYLKNAGTTSKKHLAIRSSEHFKRLLVWLKLGNHYFSDQEVKTILKKFGDQEYRSTSGHETVLFHTQYLSKILADNNALIHLFSNLQKIHVLNNGETSPDTLKTFFPLKYTNLVRKNTTSDLYYLILSLMRQESAFQEKAQSSAGAIGLMQIMPKTGGGVQRGVTPRQLLLPATNIKVGTKYLKHLISYYSGNVIYALASYNAGTHRVNRWSKVLDKFKGNPMLIMELIPYDETNNYVKFIYRNLFFYNLLYEKKAELPKTTLDFSTGLLES